jgi:TolB-like protein
VASVLSEKPRGASDASERKSHGPNAKPDPSATEVAAALERILASHHFEQATRASAFLRFVVEQTLAGHGARLKGYAVAIEVFGRPVDFDAQADPLVRVEAGRLRRRLAAYYATEGRNDPIRLSLPRGQYAPEWRYAFYAPQRRVQPTPTPVPHPFAPEAPVTRTARLCCRFSIPLAAALAVTLAVLAWSLFSTRAPLRGGDATDAGDQLPIIVAPLANLSDDEELDRWASAMTEEIVWRLDQFDVLVIDAGTRDVAAVAAENAAPYILSGSLRRGSDQTRVTVRLSEAATGAMLWSAAYDGPDTADELLALEGRVALEIAAAAAPYGPIYEAEFQRTRRAANPNPGLRDCFASYYEYRRRPGRSSYDEVLRCFNTVTTQRPELANGWGGLALIYIDALGFHYSGETGTADSLAGQARAAIATAKGLDAHNTLAELATAQLLYFTDRRGFEQAAERLLALDPNGSETLAVIGTLFALSEESDRGVALVERATALAPNPPGYYKLARAAVMLRDARPDEALEFALNIGAPDWYVMHLFVTASAALAGRMDVADRARRRLLELDPDFPHHAIERFRLWRFTPALSDAVLRGLALAGIEPVPDESKSIPSY